MSLKSSGTLSCDFIVQQIIQSHSFCSTIRHHIEICLTLYFTCRSKTKNIAWKMDYLSELFCTHVDSFNHLEEILQYVLKQNPFSNIPSKQRVATNFLKKCLSYLTYRLEDFSLIQFASEFYGKSIPETREDILSCFMMFYIEPYASMAKNHKIKLEEYRHLVSCLLLIGFGKFCSKLGFGMTTYMYINAYKPVIKKIISVISKSKEDDWEESVKSKIAVITESFSYCNTSKNKEDVIRQIYIRYYVPAKTIMRMNRKQFNAFIKKYPDNIMWSNKYSELYRQRKLLLTKYTHLLPLYKSLSRVLDGEGECDSQIRPNILSLDKIQFDIEV